MLIGEYFPAWYLGLNPDHRVIYTSYEADFAASWGMKARNVLEEWGQELFSVRVNSRSSAAKRWDIEEHKGGMNTAGARGPITGKGAHVFVIDDPVKSDQEAESKTFQERNYDWFRSVARTRLRKDGAIILVMTRWNENDLAGKLLQAAKDGGEQWTVLKLPALAKENDLLGRKEGEPLCPELHDRSSLLDTKDTLGSYWWSALYDQEPAPQGGTIFKRSWFQYFREEGQYYVLLRSDSSPKRVEKSRCWIFQTCDPAATEKEKSDFFVLATWAVTPDKDLLLLDVFREKAETVKHKKILKSQFDRWQPKFQGVENRTFGLNIIQECKGEGLPVKALDADVDKVARARPVAARYEVGTVYHRQNAPWLTEWEDELVTFPNGQKDDQVDNAAYAGIVVIGYRPAARALGSKPRGW